jgi:hypothetical protein
VRCRCSPRRIRTGAICACRGRGCRAGARPVRLRPVRLRSIGSRSVRARSFRTRRVAARRVAARRLRALRPRRRSARRTRNVLGLHCWNLLQLTSAAVARASLAPLASAGTRRGSTRFACNRPDFATLGPNALRASSTRARRRRRPVSHKSLGCARLRTATAAGARCGARRPRAAGARNSPFRGAACGAPSDRRCARPS